jgi:hypothetical protein
MVLSTQHFAEVVNYLRARAGLSLGSEKRRTTRMELRAKIVVAPVVDGQCPQRINVLTRDISIEGIGLLTAVAIKDNQSFVAFLPRSDTTTVFVLSRVLHCAVVADGLFSLGCQFDKVLTPQAAEKLQNANMADVARIRESVLR